MSESAADPAALKDAIKRSIEDLASLLRKLPDAEIPGFLDEAMIRQLLLGLQDPAEVHSHKTFGEFFLARKHRLAFIERFRVAIHRTYAFEGGKTDGRPIFVSVTGQQWFDDGVLHIEGRKPHEGHFLLYQGGEIKAAMAARDAKEGDELGPDAFVFVPLAEVQARQKAIPASAVAEIEKPLRELQALIDARDAEERHYQELFERYPWCLGAQYTSIHRHKRMDDRNIPDFIGIRSHDNQCDIIEIKPPFLEIWNKDGEPNAAFQESWAQCERYLDFARQQAPYLLSRGLSFDNPKCILVLGFDVPPPLKEEIRRKQRLNPAIQALTFNDLLVFVRSTINLLRDLRDAHRHAAEDQA